MASQEQINDATERMGAMSLRELEQVNEFLALPKKERTSLIKDAVLLKIPDQLFVVYRIVMSRDEETRIVLKEHDDDEHMLDEENPYLLCKVGDGALTITEKSVVNGRLKLRASARNIKVPKATEPAIDHPADDPRGALLALGAAWVGRDNSRPMSIVNMLRKAGVPCYVDCWFVDQLTRGDTTPKKYSKAIEEALREKLNAHKFSAAAVDQLGLSGSSGIGRSDWILTSQEHVESVDLNVGWLTLAQVNAIELPQALQDLTTRMRNDHQMVLLEFHKEEGDEEPVYVNNQAI